MKKNNNEINYKEMFDIENDTGRYGVSPTRSFSVYNDEGSVLYRGEVETIASQLRAELFGIRESDEQNDYDTGVSAKSSKKVIANREVKQKEKASKGVAKKVYVKKRAFFLVLTAILSLVILAVAVVGIFDLTVSDTAINEYISIYNYKTSENVAIDMLDPVLGFIQSTFKLDLGMESDFTANFTVGEETKDVIANYALPIALVVYVIFYLATFIASIAGACGKKGANGYKKVKLGFVSIIAFLCSLIVIVAGMMMAGLSFDGILDFIMGKGNFSIGYGLYAMVAVPIITFICSCCSYKKAN